VLTSEAIGGEVKVTRALPLGQWARTIQLSTEVQFHDLPSAYQPTPEIFEALLNQVKQKHWAIWTTAAEGLRSLEETTAICVFRTDSDTRCIILKTHAVSALLFRM
jgi:hypothetical protein